MHFKWVPNYDPGIISTNQPTLKYPKTTKMTKIPLKHKKWSRYPQNPKKKREQNNPKTYKMTKIPPKSKKWPKYPPKPKKLPKYLQNLKIIKIPPKHKKKLLKYSLKPKNDQNTPKDQKNDQNILKT